MLSATNNREKGGGAGIVSWNEVKQEGEFSKGVSR